MIIKIGSFGKRHNSTKQPAASWGTELSDVELKEDCSMEEPVFRIGFANWNSAYNYIYVPSWSRYYFVVDVTVRIGRIWEVSCRLDAAGTYRADIRGTTAFIVYANKANTEIIDSRIPINTSKTTTLNSVGLDPSLFRTQGTLAVCVVGKNSSATYMLTSISELKQMVTPADIQNQVTDELDNIDTNLSGNLLEDICKSINGLAQVMKKSTKMATGTVNLFQYIKSVIWYPWQFAIDGTVQDVYLGDFKSSYQGAPIVNPLELLDSVDVSIPWPVTGWRRNNPYTRLYVYLPFIGEFEIPTSEIMNELTLTAVYSVNKYNGDVNVELHGTDNEILGYFSGHTGISIPIGSTAMDFGNMATSVIQGVGAVAAMASGQTLPAAAMAANSIAAAKPITSFIGGGSGGAASKLDISVKCWTVFHNTVVEPNAIRATMGEPRYKVETLSTVSGFAQTERMSVTGLHMSDAVRQEINNMCDNGIFIE